MTPAEQRARSLILKHFKPEELLVGCDRPGNFHPPAQIVHNIDAPATLVDHMREDLGFPIKINSGFRSPEYNRSVGGTKLSQHQLWRALDPAPVANTAAERREKVDEMHAWLLRARGRVFEVKHREPEMLGWGTPWVAILGLRDATGIGPLSSRIPFEPCERWATRERSYGRSYLFRFAGGVGRYSWGVHVDTRGLNHSWSG